MKRRNVESSAGKLRRAAKRSKISDGYSYFCQFKFLFAWAFVIVLDFVADFRFELLYPFWVFFSSVSETFKFKGISYLFSYIFLTLTIDMICYYLIPVHWLFFASSTYVWLQFTWYSERGMTLFSIFIWMFVICMEAFFRLRELKAMPVQFEICKPFAAHGIGYPIITLGVGCKSYVHYRFRLHTKRVVAKENEFYYSLLEKALVPELLNDPNEPESLEYAPAAIASSGGSSQSSTAIMTTTFSATSNASTSLSSSTSSAAYKQHLASSLAAGSTSLLASESAATAISGSAYQSSVSSSKHSQSISVTSNGTSSFFSSSSSSAHVSSRTNSANLKNTNVAAAASENDEEDTDSQPTPTRRPFVLMRTLILFLVRAIFVAEQQISACISRLVSALLSSIHSVTSKVLSILTFEKAPSTSSKQQSGNSGVAHSANSSQLTGSAGTAESSATTAASVAGTSKESSSATGGKRRKVSLISDSSGKNTNEEAASNTGETSQSQATTNKSSRHQNGSLGRGKGNSEGTETLKKSNSSKILELPKTTTNEVKSSSSSSCNGHSPSSVSSSSSSELTNKKANISNNAQLGETGKTSTANNCISTKSAEVAILNGNLGTGVHKIGKIPADNSSVELPQSSSSTLLQLAPPLKVRKNKRSSLEDPRTLMELIKTKDDVIWKIEGDNQKLKAELQTIRQCEKDLRQQISGYCDAEKLLKANISGLQLEIEALQRKMQATQQGKQQDRTSIQRLEKMLEDEKRKAKTSSEMQAASEKKARLAEETAARANAMAEAVKNVCSESCRQRQREIEMEMNNMRKELYAKEEQMHIKDAMLEEAKGLKDKGNMLMSALSAMHDKNSQLEEALNMEKMLKMDIYAHLEDCKQQLSKQRVVSMTQDKTIRELKQKLALYSGSTQQQQQQHSSFGLLSSGGLASLNGFNPSPGGVSSSSVTDIELVNRCFSSCSPVNSVVASAASPSSLSSGTPPLGHQQSSSLLDHHRSLCNVSPVGNAGAGGVSGGLNSGGGNANSGGLVGSPFSMLGATIRDYSLDSCLSSGWPSSMAMSNNSNNSNSVNTCNNSGGNNGNNNANNCTSLGKQSPSPSSLMIANHNGGLSSSSSVSSACSSLLGNSMVNGSAGNNSKAPGTPLGIGGSGGSAGKLSDYENGPNKNVTPNLSFTNRFDI